MESGNIERFFLNTLLRIVIVGVGLILISDVLFYPADKLSIIIDCIVLCASVISYFLRLQYPTTSVLILTFIVLTAMIYQCLSVPMTTTNSLSIILLVGFIHAVMLKGKMLWTVQIITFSAVVGIFIVQFMHPGMSYTEQRNEMITIVITYSIIFLILTYATATLKASYDRINRRLRESVMDVNKKASEIEAQNSELMAMQDRMNELNTDLEKIVRERTAKVQIQNEILLKYSYTNAHHLRGPVARLLGLANLYRLESAPDSEFIITKMAEQANEIDEVIRKINEDLEEGHEPELGLRGLKD
jgi:signal transduction histidine kinase